MAALQINIFILCSEVSTRKNDDTNEFELKTEPTKVKFYINPVLASPETRSDIVDFKPCE